MNKILLGITSLLLLFLGISHIIYHAKENHMPQEDTAPKYLYKVVSVEDWQESRQKGRVVNSPMDEEFIHLATESQLAHITQKFWNGKSYLILKLDPDKLQGRLVLETNPGGTTKYYHLYDGIIPLDAVVEAQM